MNDVTLSQRIKKLRNTTPVPRVVFALYPDSQDRVRGIRETRLDANPP
jgi:hypothetical protein